MSTAQTGPRREDPLREDPLHPAKDTAAAREDDIRRTRAEIAETVSELADRVNQLPTKARQAAWHGLMHPATIAAALLVMSVLWWRLRRRW